MTMHDSVEIDLGPCAVVVNASKKARYAIDLSLLFPTVEEVFSHKSTNESTRTHSALCSMLFHARGKPAEFRFARSLSNRIQLASYTAAVGRCLEEKPKREHVVVACQ